LEELHKEGTVRFEAFSLENPRFGAWYLAYDMGPVVKAWVASLADSVKPSWEQAMKAVYGKPAPFPTENQPSPIVAMIRKLPLDAKQLSDVYEALKRYVQNFETLPVAEIIVHGLSFDLDLAKKTIANIEFFDLHHLAANQQMTGFKDSTWADQNRHYAKAAFVQIQIKGDFARHFILDHLYRSIAYVSVYGLENVLANRGHSQPRDAAIILGELQTRQIVKMKMEDNVQKYILTVEFRSLVVEEQRKQQALSTKQ
jgi:hypothetical protein